MKRVLKIIGIVILLLSMAYASNWDLPKDARTKRLVNHETHVEELEAWQGSIPAEYLKGEDNE